MNDRAKSRANTAANVIQVAQLRALKKEAARTADAIAENNYLQREIANQNDDLIRVQRNQLELALAQDLERRIDRLIVDERALDIFNESLATSKKNLNALLQLESMPDDHSTVASNIAQSESINATAEALFAELDEVGTKIASLKLMSISSMSRSRFDSIVTVAGTARSSLRTIDEIDIFQSFVDSHTLNELSSHIKNISDYLSAKGLFESAEKEESLRASVIYVRGYASVAEKFIGYAETYKENPPPSVLLIKLDAANEIRNLILSPWGGNPLLAGSEWVEESLIFGKHVCDAREQIFSSGEVVLDFCSKHNEAMPVDQRKLPSAVLKARKQIEQLIDGLTAYCDSCKSLQPFPRLAINEQLAKEVVKSGNLIMGSYDALPLGVRSKLGKWSMWLGIASIVGGGFLTGIPAIILGHKARREIANDPKFLGDDGQAKIGIALGAVMSIFGFYVLIFPT